jgi:hypothetical protein
MKKLKEFFIYNYLSLFKMLPVYMVLLFYDHLFEDVLFLVDSIRTNKYKIDSIYVLRKTNLAV